MDGSEDPPTRDCMECESTVRPEDIIDTWGEPSPLQVLAYECSECGTVSGYFRSVTEPPMQEFRCNDRDEYARLYGSEPAMHRAYSGTRVSLCESLLDGADSPAPPNSELDIELVSGEDSDVSISRGDTLSLPDSDYESMHEWLLTVRSKDTLGDWFIVHNTRFVRMGSDQEQAFIEQDQLVSSC